MKTISQGNNFGVILKILEHRWAWYISNILKVHETSGVKDLGSSVNTVGDIVFTSKKLVSTNVSDCSLIRVINAGSSSDFIDCVI